MDFTLAENPRRRRKARKTVRRKRAVKRISTRRRKVGFGARRRHRKPYTASVVHATLRRKRKGHYRMSPVSHKRYPKVRLSTNPRRRRRRSNPGMSLAGFDLMTTGKTLAGVVAVNAVSTELLKVLPVASVTTDPTMTRVIGNGVKLGVAVLGGKYVGKKFLGEKAMHDVITFITILVVIDLIKTFAGTSATATTITQYLGAVTPQPGYAPATRQLGRASMGQIVPSVSLNGADNLNALQNQGM